jgi:hypothetical protein
MKFYKKFNDFIKEAIAPDPNTKPATTATKPVVKDQAVFNTIGASLNDFTTKNALKFNFKDNRPSTSDKDLRSCLMDTSVSVIDRLDDVCKKLFTDEILSKVQGSVIDVEGYTSSTGADQYNMDLSNRRALLVVDYILKKYKDILTKYNIRLNPLGFGETKRLISNDYFPDNKLTPLVPAEKALLQAGGEESKKLIASLESNQDARQSVNRRVVISLQGYADVKKFVVPDTEKKPEKPASPVSIPLPSVPVTFNWNSFVPSENGLNVITEMIKKLGEYNKQNPNNRKDKIYVITHTRFGLSDRLDEQLQDNKELSYNRCVFITKMFKILDPSIRVIALPTLNQIKDEPGCIFDYDEKNEVVQKAIPFAKSILDQFGAITQETNYISDKKLQSAETDISNCIIQKKDLNAEQNYRRIPVEYLYVYNGKYPPNPIIEKCLESFVGIGKETMKSLISVMNKALVQSGADPLMYNITNFAFRERKNTESAV